MDNQGIIDLGDLRIMPYRASPENCINSIQDFIELDTKITRRLSYYNLPSFLIKIHDFLLEHQESNMLFPFTAINGIMSKYIILNSDIAGGWSPIFDEEYLYFFNIIFSCSLYDPEFEERSQHSNEDFASLLLRKIGSQTRWNIQLHNLWGRTFYIYRELIEKSDAHDLIRDIAAHKFEEKFGLSLFDFIKLGFIVFCGSQKPGPMNREYFNIARRQKLPIPEDDTIMTFLKHISINSLTFRNICANNVDSKNYPKTYEFNPLFNYPLIRLNYDDAKRVAKYDEFIAPVPQLLANRFTTGLYYQLFNAFGKNKFSDSFGLLFEDYVNNLLHWYNLPGKIISEREIRPKLRSHKGRPIKIPDWIISCEEGVILLECKATKYSQGIYEYGLNASWEAKGCIRQLSKGIKQLTSFERFIPQIMQAYGITYKNLQIQKVIVTFESLVAQNEGPLRNWMNIEPENNKSNCKIIWVWYLEEIQPYIAKGASLWSFLVDFPKLEFNEIINKMQNDTGACYSDSVLCKIEDEIYDELIKHAQ